MGEMADLHDYGYSGPDSKPRTINDIRTDIWKTKDGRRIKIGKMEHRHLLSAYKLSGDKRLFKEIVVRLFEDKIKYEL